MTCRQPLSSSMRKRLALITWSGLPQGAESERLMLPYLADAGIETQIVDWCNAGGDFSKFDLVVLRSCWDYHLRGNEFAEWLRRTAREVPILNDPETILWNLNKFYLREMPALGIEIAPTVFVNGLRHHGAYDIDTLSAAVRTARARTLLPAAR